MARDYDTRLSYSREGVLHEVAALDLSRDDWEYMVEALEFYAREGRISPGARKHARNLAADLLSEVVEKLPVEEAVL